VEVAAHFDAQLPELLRGVFFGGWNPSRVSQKYDRAAYVTRFAREARIRDSDAVKAARIVSAVARRRMSAGVVAEAFGLLPADLRDLLEPAASEVASAETSSAGHRSPAGQRDHGRAQCLTGLVPAADHGRLPVVTLIDDLRQGLQPGCGAEVVAGIAARIKELDEILRWHAPRLPDPVSQPHSAPRKHAPRLRIPAPHLRLITAVHRVGRRRDPPPPISRIRPCTSR